MSKAELTVQERHEKEMGDRFRKEVAEHELTVLHDHGLYRHLRFKKPGTSFGWFDLITWPNNLTINGDMGTFTFSRVEDMLTFFRGERINPHYWQEKIRGSHSGTEWYSEERFHEELAEPLADFEKDYPDRLATHQEATTRYAATSWRDKYPMQRTGPRDPGSLISPAEARELVEEHRADGTLDNEDGARFVLSELEKGGVLTDTWEWTLKEYTAQYLWCCYAIPWGIARYDAVAPARRPGVVAATWYQAACDRCGCKLLDADEGLVLDDTAAKVAKHAMGYAWAVYRGQLCCNDCVGKIGLEPHDFVTSEVHEPFCAICQELPDAEHLNVPQPGQLEVTS